VSSSYYRTQARSCFCAVCDFIIAALWNRAGHCIFALWFLSFFFFLFLACFQRSEIGCLPYFHTWYGLSANLECMSEILCCTWLTGNTWCKNDAKNRYLHIIAQLCRAVSLQLRHVSKIWKKNLLNNNMSSTCFHNMTNFGPLTAESGSGVWGTPANFNRFRVLPSLLQRRRLQEANQTLHAVSTSPGLVHYIYIFGSSCSLTEFCPMKNSLYVQVLRSSILATLLHGTPAAGVSQTVGRHTRNGITELLQKAPPIFGRAAIMLGIGLHFCYLSVKYFGNHWTDLTEKTCLVPRMDEFECQGQRSRSLGTKNALCTHVSPQEWNALAANNVTQQQMAPLRCCQGVILGACVWFMCGRTSSAVVVNSWFRCKPAPERLSQSGF